MVDMGELDAAEGEQAREKLPKFPEVVDNDSLGGQRGYMLEMVRSELRDEGFSDAEIQGGGLRVTTTFTRRAMRAATRGVLANRPEGLRQLHVASASIDPRIGRAARLLRRPGLPAQQRRHQLGHRPAARPGSSFKPFALTAGLKDGYSLESTFEGNSPLEVGDSDFENQGEDGGSDYGSAVTLLKATEDSINTAYVDLTLALSDGPQAVVDTAVDMGIPQEVHRPATRSRRRARLGHRQPDRHGQLLRHDRRRRARQGVVRGRTASALPTARTATPTRTRSGG